MHPFPNGQGLCRRNPRLVNLVFFYHSCNFRGLLFNQNPTVGGDFPLDQIPLSHEIETLIEDVNTSIQEYNLKIPLWSMFNSSATCQH